MSTSTHDAAIFEEGFMLVAVSSDDIDNYGKRTLWEAIQGHPWVLEQEIPVVIVYHDDDGSIDAYGDSDLVDSVTQMNFDDIVWGHELTLDWE
jgi:hypothetical protein